MLYPVFIQAFSEMTQLWVFELVGRSGVYYVHLLHSDSFNRARATRC